MNSINKITLKDELYCWILKQYSTPMPAIPESEQRKAGIYKLTFIQIMAYTVCALFCLGLIICLFLPYVTVHFKTGDVQYSIAQLSGTHEPWSPLLDLETLFYIDLIGLICCLLPIFIPRRWARHLIWIVLFVFAANHLIMFSAGFIQAIGSAVQAGADFAWRVFTLGRGHLGTDTTYDLTAVSAWINTLLTDLYWSFVAAAAINLIVTNKIQNEHFKKEQR